MYNCCETVVCVWNVLRILNWEQLYVQLNWLARYIHTYIIKVIMNHGNICNCWVFFIVSLYIWKYICYNTDLCSGCAMFYILCLRRVHRGYSIIGSGSGFTTNPNPKWIRLTLDTPKSFDLPSESEPRFTVNPDPDPIMYTFIRHEDREYSKDPNKNRQADRQTDIQTLQLIHVPQQHSNAHNIQKSHSTCPKMFIHYTS